TKIGNEEIKKKAASRTEINQTRVKILGKSKRQLHFRIKDAGKEEEMIYATNSILDRMYCFKKCIKLYSKASQIEFKVVQI
ncbi:hypothetical protein CU098_011538, partial [Rhizopus stolonifer]